MIRTNLATRPFYNEQAVQLWLLVLVTLVVGATAFNVFRVISCLLYTSPSPRDGLLSRMPSSA